MLENITATSHPMGNRIDLKWINPVSDEYPGVRVMRRENTHPRSPTDGIFIADIKDENESLVSDIDLKGETVYYYSLFPFKGDPREYLSNSNNRISALATGSYNFAGQMMDLLPAIYHRYDTVHPTEQVPAGMPEEDKNKGQLQRFLDIPGSHLDQLYSFTKAMLNLYDSDKVDGNMLALLGQWIGWDTDFTLEISARRSELRNAPTWYKTVGVIPNTESTIKRVSGWESRTKEFVHNVFLSNRPERLNLWESIRQENGDWSKSIIPLSLNFAYEGRPAIVSNSDGTVELFYQTLKNKQWDIWYKKLSVVNIDLEFEKDLNVGVVSLSLQQKFVEHGFSLSQNAKIKQNDNEWLINCIENNEVYTIRKTNDKLDIYRWSPSKPLTNRQHIDKHPAAALQGDKLWIFWDVYNENEGKSYIHFRNRSDSRWSENDSDKPFETNQNERKRPSILVDDAGGLWLFWLEREDGDWELKYNRHNGTEWGSVVSFPMDSGDNPKVDSDLFAMFHPNDAQHPIWLFWSHREHSATSGQLRWKIAYRVKKSMDHSDSTDWSVVRQFPKPDEDSDDCEPAVKLNANGEIELFWSSNRDGSWSILNSKMNDLETNNWADAEQISDNPFSQHDPLPFVINDKTILIYRSNESINYSNEIYKATKTVDFRYSGSTTIDSRNAAKISLRSAFGDFQTYTYHTGKSNDDWYARDTIAAYLTPGTENDDRIVRKRNIIAGVLRNFLPAQVRPVFLLQQVNNEMVYSYTNPDADSQDFIDEQMTDTILSEVYRGLSDSYEDTI